MADTTETTPAPSAPHVDAPPDADRAGATAASEAIAPAPAGDSAPPTGVAAAPSVDTSPPSVGPSSQSAAVNDALTATRAEAEWRVVGETVPGASHLRAGIPNQDAILYARQSSARLPVIVSISDGHGSDKCFRSHRGSRFAVRIGCDLLDELVGGRHTALPPSELEAAVRESLTSEFVRRWRAAVEADLKREPLREEEFARMIERDGEGSRRLVESNPYLAYGATSLSLLLTPTYALYLQLGDGEMVTVSEAGGIGHPLPEDMRLLANETTSLCLDKAAEDFRFAVHPHGEGELPALILMTTDGYYNSFSTTAGFHQVGGDLIQMLREDGGFGAVNRGVKGWLEEATAAGSGDDCTLAIVCRMDALKAASSSDTTKAIVASDAPPESALPESALPQPAASDAATPAAPHEQPAAPKTT